jgi:fatty acid desaturase
VASHLFVVWNLLGMLDLIVAVSTGTLSSGIVPGLAGGITTAPMVQLPLVLIPAYLVPLFFMFHLTALFQSRRLAASARSDERARQTQPVEVG